MFVIDMRTFIFTVRKLGKQLQNFIVFPIFNHMHNSEYSDILVKYNNP